MKTSQKIAIALIILLIIVIAMLVRPEASLNGTYVSESDWYSIEFHRDGTCTWYESGYFFDGYYQKAGDGWQLNIMGGGLYNNTVFFAKPEGRDLYITGGEVGGEIFTKK